MNKYLLMSAAAIFAGTASANARLHSFTFATAGGTPYCDGGTVLTGVDGGALSGAVWAWTHTNNNCASGTSEGQGLLGKTTGFGKIADMSDNLFAKNYQSYNEIINFTLPKKLKTGQPWTMWIETLGSTAFEGNSGILVNAKPGHSGTQSTLASVKSLIQARREALKHKTTQ